MPDILRRGASRLRAAARTITVTTGHARLPAALDLGLDDEDDA